MIYSCMHLGGQSSHERRGTPVDSRHACDSSDILCVNQGFIVQAGLGMKPGEMVSVQLCLFLFNPVFHACVYLFYFIQFFMHAR